MLQLSTRRNILFAYSPRKYILIQLYLTITIPLASQMFDKHLQVVCDNTYINVLAALVIEEPDCLLTLALFGPSSTL